VKKREGGRGVKGRREVGRGTRGTGMDASGHASFIEQITTLPQATTGGRHITCLSTVSMSTCWVAEPCVADWG